MVSNKSFTPADELALIEGWIDELRAEQQALPATSKGYREAALLAWRIGTLEGYAASLRETVA